MQDEITACLEKGFELGVRWTDDNGVLNDAYESNRPENFAPACWAVVGASLYRLSGEDVYLEWTDRWMKRTAEIMEGARNSPGFREYVMGYGAMVFPILSDVVDRDVLERWEAEFTASYTDDAALSDCHVSAASLLCDLFLDGGREEKASKRSGEFIDAFNRRLTSGGFLRDDDVNGHSVAHVYLTGTFLAAALLNGESDGYRVSEHDRRQIRRLLETICAWFKRANGQFHLPFLASRSIYQMYVYPMVALLSFIGEGEEGQGKNPRASRLLPVLQSRQGRILPYAEPPVAFCRRRPGMDLQPSEHRPGCGSRGLGAARTPDRRGMDGVRPGRRRRGGRRGRRRSGVRDSARRKVAPGLWPCATTTGGIICRSSHFRSNLAIPR